MQITIGKLDPATGTVTVTFDLGNGLVHTRPVNAVLTSAGKLDAKATRDRAEQVGMGVARKFELGVIAPDTKAD